ncbi:MAG: translation initiation factor IF-2 [Thermoplasmata archaeon M8B2D]|nr:MAG: translation initiation factor IF-2 [Thermoplasmata archaeon M8B2D]
MNSEKIRQAIVTVAGHVDHGKTSILDALRGSSVQEKEAGGITQKISFTLYPTSQLKNACPLIDKQGIKLNIPGFLFIDTPGHAAFTNLRKRGGNLADLAILVIDINEGIKPQTAEVIQILKLNKVPFLIALNKVDKISGWQTHAGSSSKGNPNLRESINSQPVNVKQNFDEKYLTLIGALQSHGFDSDIYYNITNFTKKIALVPCSARTQEGIPELILMLCGLSQRYLAERLKLGNDAKGIMLEIKKDQANYIESILYDGTLNRNDPIAVSDFEGKPIITKIRVLEEILPLSTKFKPKESVTAATGLRLQLVTKEEILPGMPFVIYKNNEKELENLFKKEISGTLGSKLSKQGIIAKADSLGSLEALLTLLAQEKIPVVKAGIGSINKTDVIRAKANLKINELDSVIVGFNVDIDSDANEIKGNSKILTEDVIYKLIERVQEFREDKKREIEKKRLLGLTALGKVTLLKQYVFRNTNPAIFGVRVDTGKIISGLNMIDQNNEKVGKIKNIQSEGKSVNEATEGMEVAISIPGINYERRLKDDVNSLYSDISESQFKNFKKNKDLLSSNELSLLSELAQIKEKSKEGWGQ